MRISKAASSKSQRKWRRFPGNLLVLPDGRVGFIDFGIVGRVSPVTWGAVEALLAATQARPTP